MMNGELREPGSGTSSPPASNVANSAGSNFSEMNEGFSEGSGAALNPVMDVVASWTDITLDQAIVKMKEIDRENLFLKESLAENTRQIKRHFEMLVTYREKDKEKFEQKKALIMSQSEEIKELQIKLMAQEDKEKEYENRLATLENENAHLQRQKALSEQRVFNIFKQAENHGVMGLENLDSLPDMTDAVLVTTEDKEKELEELEASVVAKEELITSLRNELLTVNNQRDQYKISNEILLKDMDGLQRQKQELDVERRQLYEQNKNLNKELDKQMQSNIASTKKEIEVQKNVTASAGGNSTDTRQNLQSRLSTNDSLDFLDDAENLEMFDVKLTLEQTKADIEKLKSELQMEKTDKEDVELKMKELQSEMTELKSQHKLAQEKIDMLEKQKIKLSEEFEENLTSISHQRQESKLVKSQEAQKSEDHNVLRAQIVSLLHDVDELNNRLSAAGLAIQQKDRRITELSGMNEDWKENYNDQWHQSNTVIQTLQTRLTQQDRMTQQCMTEHNVTKQQYQELQDNFNRLVTDYKDLLEMFESERSKIQQKETSKEIMEEMNKMAAQVIAAEEAINYRDKQLDDFKRQFSQMDEKIKLLHIQLDTYQSDFQTEREARTKIAQEKSDLDEELRTSQEQIRALSDQFNQLKMQEMQRRANQRPNSYEGQGSPHGPHSMDDQRPYSYQSRDPPRPQNNYGVPNYPPQNQRYRMAQADAGGHLQAYGGMLYQQQQQMPPPQYDDQNGDPFPSMYQCPSCNMILPDADSLQLHVPDCLDKGNQQ